MPYECSDLLKRHPPSSLLPVAERIISAVNSNNIENECASPVCNEYSGDDSTTATFIVFDTNEEETGQCANASHENENSDENIGLFPLRRHLNRQQLFEGDEELSEDEDNELLVADNDERLVENDEMEDMLEDLSHPMDDVNMKIDSHIEAQFPSDAEEEIIDVVSTEDTCQNTLSPIGSHLGRQSTLFGGSSLMEVAKCQKSDKNDQDVENVYQTVVFPSNERRNWSSKSNYHVSSSFYSCSNTLNTTISYQYESKEEPLEYKVHDREDEQPFTQRQHYREGHADYDQLDFSNHSSSHTLNQRQCITDKRLHFNSVQDQEEFERQHRRHFSGRLYERCNFTRFNQNQSHSEVKSGSRLRLNHAVSNSSSSHTSQTENKVGRFASDRKLSSSFSRVHRSNAWRTITKSVDDQAEAIEEGTDIAAEMESDPPQPLRSSSDWLRRQFSYIGQNVLGFSTNNQEPNLSSILATPLSPPFVKPSEAQRIPFPKGFHGFENGRENLKDEGNDEDRDDDMKEESPPKIFHCSPPGSPPEENSALVFECSEDEEDLYGQIENSEQSLKCNSGVQDDEEGFFDDEEDDDCDDDCEEHRGHYSPKGKAMRKRKTTGTGAGRLAVLEKRPCCNEESGECESPEPNHTEECTSKAGTDSDSGVDVNGALADVFCEESGSSGFSSKSGAKSVVSKSTAGRPADQTVPVATLYL
ncbi:hypothetical protein Ddc_07381 [Ditylenchus destructor]|nr:hypothetical protein Ddc_07381 [Ditylenchus destructor]